MSAMTGETIRATVEIPGPLGPRRGETHSVTVPDNDRDHLAVAEALMRLFRRFTVPPRAIVEVSGYGKTVLVERDDCLVTLARQLLAN